MLPLVLSLPVIKAFWPLSCDDRQSNPFARCVIETRTHLALRQINEGIVGEDNGDVGLGLGLALVDSANLLHVDGPRRGLLCLVRDLELEDTVGLIARGSM